MAGAADLAEPQQLLVQLLDPDSRVAGRGVSILRRAGIEVAVGCEEAAARQAMEGFLSLKGRGRPFLTLKLAVSADGCIGRRGAGQVAITGPVARDAAQMMRLAHEAIMVGVGTVIEDDPLLTVRLEGLRERSPVRVVIDPFARTPPEARLLAERQASGVMLLVTEKAPRSAVDALRQRGASVHLLASDYKGRFDPREIVRFLGVTGLKSILVEGGADTARRFLEAELVDRIALFRSAVVVGEGEVAAPVALDNVPEGYTMVRSGVFGEDRLFEYERQT